MNHPDPTLDYNEEQQMDEQERQYTIITALLKVYNVGLEDEALLLAFEAGSTILKQFEREIENG